MNKKITALTLLFMAFVGFTIAGAISAASEFPPPPNNNYFKTISKITITYPNNPSTPWDDQQFEINNFYKTGDKSRVWIHMKLSLKERTNNPYYKEGYWWKPLKEKNGQLVNVAYKKHWYNLRKTKFVRQDITTTTYVNGIPKSIKKVKDYQTSISAYDFYWKNRAWYQNKEYL
ncbi:MAG: hypothetical protein QMD61_00160 [Methanobacterium sp.]|nr:hypothetical protein [Methanobacterium sp.]